MSATRNPPKCYSADGIPIYYSTELHSKRKKLLDASDTAAPPDTPIYRIKLTLRLPKKHKRTGTLEYGKIIFEQVCESPYGRDCTSEQLEQFIATQTPHFWKTAFKVTNPDILINIFDPAKGLPLLIAWSTNRLLLAKQKDWSDGTLKKKDYIISQLLNFGWGNIPIGSLTVEHCGATLIEHLSSASHKNAITLLNQIATYERLQKRLSTDTVPLKRPLRGKHSRSQPTTYVRQHIRANTLTQQQVATIISDTCQHNLEKFSNQNYLVLLLVAVMSIPVEELCYIRLSDITLGRDGLSDKALSSRYLFHHAKNTSRGCNPQSFTKWINHRYKNKLRDHRFLDGNCKVIPTSVTTSPYSQTVYSRYERGYQVIPVIHLLKLADLYKTSTDYLLGRTQVIDPYPKS